MGRIPDGKELHLEVMVRDTLTENVVLLPISSFPLEGEGNSCREEKLVSLVLARETATDRFML